MSWLPNTAKTVFWTAISPLQNAVDFVYDGLAASIANWKEWSRIKEENERLQATVFQLQRDLAGYERVLNENLRLRRLLSFVEKKPSYTYLGARVIGKSPVNWYSRLIINRGSRDGLKAGMPVITYNGSLVGEVGEVFPDSAQVVTIFDPVFVVGGIVQREESRTVGIVKSGENPLIIQQLIMDDIPWDGDIRKDDIIVTSGLAEGFPKGLPIGTVLEVKQEDYGLTQSAKLQAFMTEESVEEVLVVVDF
ncbi:MAG: rod shape-determining protein MreC [Halanaerobium sp.]|nr:rod shape-determining protein MreC [Halanaerobium sp.]